jgi:thiamine-phosphate pyrophosphorylase
MAPQSSNPQAILCAVLDGTALAPDPLGLASALFSAGVDWIQLRDRALEADALLDLACALVEARDAAAVASKNCRVIVNKRIDIVLSSGADGAHLGFDALDPTSVAALLPKTDLIGTSVHSIPEIQALAETAPDDRELYAHLAPIWDPFSKPASRPALGPDLLAAACGLGLPILAQGGIDPQRASQAIRAGAAGVAVTGILGRPENQITAVRQLRAALDGQTPFKE